MSPRAAAMRPWIICTGTSRGVTQGGTAALQSSASTFATCAAKDATWLCTSAKLSTSLRCRSSASAKLLTRSSRKACVATWSSWIWWLCACKVCSRDAIDCCMPLKALLLCWASLESQSKPCFICAVPCCSRTREVRCSPMSIDTRSKFWLTCVIVDIILCRSFWTSAKVF